MQPVSLANAALYFFAALACAQLAILCLRLARDDDRAGGAQWWAAALIAQALRFAAIGAGDALPAATAGLIRSAGQAPVAALVLAGALALTASRARPWPLLFAAGLAAAAIAVAPLYAAMLREVGMALTAAAAGALLAAAGFLSHRFLAERRIGSLAAILPLILSGLYLLVVAASAVGFAWPGAALLPGAWGAALDLGLTSLSLVGLVHVIFAQTRRDDRAAEISLREAIESLPIGVALFDADDRLVACNSLHKTLHPLAPPTTFQAGQRFEDALRGLAEAGVYAIKGDELERYVQKRVATRRTGSGQPVVVNLGDGRWLQVNETGTASGGIVSAWTDITGLKRREQALAILIDQSAQNHSIFEAAAEALATGLGCRWAGVAELISGHRGRILSIWVDGGRGTPFEFDMEGTPCSELHADGDYCLFPDRLAELFPRDAFLAEVGAVSYRGQIIRDAEGEMTAYVFALDDKPMTDEPWRKDLMALIARWVGMAYLKTHAEEELRESQRRFQDFAESASDWCWEMDENLRFTYLSHGFEEKAGVDPARLLGRTREELLSTGDPIRGDVIVRADWNAHLADLKAHRPFRRFVHPRVQADGSVRYLSIDGRPIFDAAGNFQGYRGSGRDVTERIVAEHALRESASRLEKAQAQAKIGYWRWSFENEMLVYWSDEAARIAGLELHGPEINYEDTTKTVHPDDRDRVLAEYRAADRELRNFEIDYRIVLPDGEIRYVHEIGEVEYSDDGEPIGHTGTVQDVTALKRAEAALRTSQASLADAQRMARLGNWDWNIVTNELFWSDEIYRIFGLEPGEFGADYEAFMERVHPRDRAAVQKAVDDALAGAPYAIDHRIVRPDGMVRVVHEQGEVDFDSGGKPAFMRGAVQDVTEQRQALAALAEREQRIRAITDNVGDALVTIDTHGTIDSVNPAMERMFGYTADEMIGSNVSMLMAEPDRSKHDAYLEKYARSKRKGIFAISGRELIGQRKDGSLVDVEILVNEMFHGRKQLFLGTIRDITERVQAREAERRKILFIELSKAVSAAANEATSLAKALQTGVDQVCHLLDWPLGHVYLLPEPDSDVLQSSGIWRTAEPEAYDDLIHLTRETRFAAGEGVPGRVLQSGQAVCIGDTRQDDDDPRIGCARRLGLGAMFAFPIAAGSRIAGVIEFFSKTPGEPEPETIEVMDYVGAQLGRVVERALAQHALIAAKEAAEHANRAKTDFLATMSHELRTPLNAIIGFSEIMADETFGPLGHGNYKDYAAGIRNSGSHLLNIINDILDVSKAEAGRIVLKEEAIDIAETIDSALGQVRHAAKEKGLAIEVDLQPNTPHVRADRLRIKQIVLNLLSNAIKFTTEGSITVRLRATEQGDFRVQVIDTGMGIAEDDIERVFEPFMQADSSLQRSHEGTGLGLPLCRSLAKLHGGSLTLESKFGAGTVATLLLPPERVLTGADAA